MIPLSWKTKLILFSLNRQSVNDFSFHIPDSKKRRIFIFLAADYGNLGDVAITYAQHKFLNSSFSECIITEIPISKTLQGIAFVKKIIKPNDVVTTVGGGNMGDLYQSIEHFRCLVIKNFNKNQIVSFPQTIDFQNNKKGIRSLNKTVNIYSKHPNLTLVAREHKSFDYYNIHFTKNKILLTPDIVLSQNQSIPQLMRKGAIVCLRDDKEKKLTNEQETKLVGLLKNEFNKVTYRDTHIGGHELSLKRRVESLKLIWADFKTAELVITDRLHGMIFCYITGTPALVFLNNNHKVKSSFFWIKNASHIKLVENLTDESIKSTMHEVKGKHIEIDSNSLTKKYDSLIKVIKTN
ncbi:polysaccharide pyruvyl transferase family protein [uncultured Algibacter sp.]|uniref:polysaccharide pyruvyl transferase family protein n=1 Tax=uncultured Algibacter sp. TaxID=298659 RepID=UPI00260A442E|nr:polysaccharide pyruvyl transferase family protein [uncultured Algibacter sp.]